MFKGTNLAGKAHFLSNNNIPEPSVKQRHLGAALSSFAQTPSDALRSMVDNLSSRCADDVERLALAEALLDCANELERRISLPRTMGD